MVLNRANQSRDFAGSAENSIYQQGAGGFAVGASHGSDGKALVGTVKEVSGRSGKSEAAMRNLQPGAAETGRARALADNGHGTLGHRSACKLGAVCLGARKREEQEAGSYFAAVIGQAENIDLRQLGRKGGRERHAPENLRELHRANLT